MMKHLFLLSALLSCFMLQAQNPPAQDSKAVDPYTQDPLVWQRPPQERILYNEVGFHYATQRHIGSGPLPELEMFSLDYARYFGANIGFRTGLNIYFDDTLVDCYSVPLQFSLRSKRYGSQLDTSDEDSRTWLLTLLWGLVPKKFEMHSGFTPGVIFGNLAGDDWNEIDVRRRFTCTFDLGLKVIIPIWRFNFYGDFTYHCFLNNNFRVVATQKSLSRSYVGLGVGMSFDF